MGRLKNGVCMLKIKSANDSGEIRNQAPKFPSVRLPLLVFYCTLNLKLD